MIYISLTIFILGLIVCDYSVLGYIVKLYTTFYNIKSVMFIFFSKKESLMQAYGMSTVIIILSRSVRIS